MSGKRAFLEMLKQEGVEIVFGNPGTTELPLMDAFAVENEIRYVLGLQEAAVMAMADGYAQASGKLAVVNLHVTPGPRQRDGHALRRAEGRLADPRHRRPAGQEFTVTEPILSADLPAMARPLVKWAARSTASRTCRCWCIAPPRPRSRRRPGRCSCRCPAISSRTKPTST